MSDHLNIQVSCGHISFSFFVSGCLILSLSMFVYESVLQRNRCVYLYVYIQKGINYKELADTILEADDPKSCRP